ncbi:hypothetical protein PBY51_000093 [Eleginops maclovinus]|uniref:Secreted protein n=1 Tax=Eleginops maclovinus TaxID=56733 RepID=A0AAN7XL67_ELEMC|nr:hypothetical protein PBY51_000093 [Eleginops maclovinus]
MRLTVFVIFASFLAAGLCCLPRNILQPLGNVVPCAAKGPLFRQIARHFQAHFAPLAWGELHGVDNMLRSPEEAGRRKRDQ